MAQGEFQAELVHDVDQRWHTPWAQKNLGLMYDTGQGVKQHTATKRLSRQSHGTVLRPSRGMQWRSMYNLITYDQVYATSEGVPQDIAEALKWPGAGVLKLAA